MPTENGCVSWFGLGPLSPARGKQYATAHNDILENCVCGFGEGPFLFQHDSAPVHKASSIRKRFPESGEEEFH